MMGKLIVLSLLLATTCWAQASRKKNDGANFDYFMLVRIYPDAVCRADDDTVPDSCEIPKGTPMWTLHGLWPNYADGSYPQFCKGHPRKYDQHAIDPIRETLLKFWPNYYPTKTADSFWKHEYEKHGTCSQSLPDFDSELKYFNKSLDLNALYDLEKGMREKLVPREKPYDRSTFELSLKAGVSENRRLEISCVRDKKTKQVLLADIRICLNKTSLRPIDCPVKVNQSAINAHWYVKKKMLRKAKIESRILGESPPLPGFYECPDEFYFLQTDRLKCNQYTMFHEAFFMAPSDCHRHCFIIALFYFYFKGRKMVQNNEDEAVKWARKLVAELWRNSLSTVDFSYEIRKECREETGQFALRLAEELLYSAGSLQHFHTIALDCLQLLVHSEYLSWPDYLRVISLYSRFDNQKCVFQLCQLLEDQLPSIECGLQQGDCDRLRDAVIQVAKWLLRGIEFCCQDELRIHQETGRRLMQTTRVFAQDPFISRLLSISAQQMPELPTTISHLLQNAEDSEYLDHSEAEALESLSLLFDKTFKPLKFEMANVISGNYRLRCSSIRSLVSVYACFRVLTPAAEVADVIFMFSQLHKYTFESAVFDLIHSTLMIQVQEQEMIEGSKFKWSIVVFLFLKLPDILSHLTKNREVPREATERALGRIVNEYKTLIDDIDAASKCNTLKCLIMELVQNGTMDEGIAGRLNSRREDQLQATPELSYLIREMYRSSSEYNMMQMARSTSDVVLKTLSQKQYASYLKLFSSMTGSGGVTFEATCALYARDSTLGHFTSGIASASLMLQNRIKFGNRHKIFDYTFIMLTKVSMIYDMLTFDEIVNGFGGATSPADNRDCIFYKWSVKYLKRISPSPIEVTSTENSEEEKSEAVKMETDEPENNASEGGKEDAEMDDPQMQINRAEYREKADRWKQGNLFWVADDADFESAINLLSFVAEQIFEDYKTKEHRLNLEEMKNIINSMRNATCLLVCMIEWLDCQKTCEAKRIMARHIIAVLEEITHEDIEDGRLRFVFLMCRPILDETIDTPIVASPIPNALMIIANRDVPKMRRNQIPDQEILRKAWFGIQRQNWASPYILRILEHANRARTHKEWIHFFVHHMLKMNCPDMMAKTIDLLSACTMLDAAGTLIRILETLVDSMIKEHADASDNMQFCHPFVMPLVALLTQVLLLSVWVAHKGPTLQQNNESAKNVSAEDGEKSDWELLEQSVEVTINRFAKLAQRGMMSLCVCVVCHTLREIAAAPDSEPKRLLTKMIPHKMLFQLARVCPASMPVELFANFCQSEEGGSLDEQLRYLCSLKKYGGF
ncbi:hypothetical protein WR25_25518 [Diploscapter pachys]|uniref:Uncharacterized protein n=1 Tax=Diploscapter pachys TaxID=2018661 RepID=A0A2A2JFF3_9BILA|nr:hypothetical protein WR25_25518 [Diploscapter pachys]